MLPGIDLLDLDRFQRLEHHEMFRRLRAEDPVSWQDHPSGRGFWNVVKYADVVAVNRDSELYSSEIGGTGILDPDEMDGAAGGDPRGVMMLYMDPPKHTRYRLLVNKGFTPRMIGLLEQYLRHRSTLIVDNVIERGSCDFVEDLAAELPLQAIADIMGVPQEDRQLLFSWSNRMIGFDDPEYASTDGAEAAGELYIYVNELAKQRRADPRDDIVTRLINAEIDGDRLSRARVRHVHAPAHRGRQRDDPQHHIVGDVGADAAPRAIPCPSRRSRAVRPGRSRRSCAGHRRCTTSGAPPRPTPRSAARPSPRATRS